MAVGDVRERSDRPLRAARRPRGHRRDAPAPRPLRHRRCRDVDARDDRDRAGARRGRERRLGRWDHGRVAFRGDRAPGGVPPRRATCRGADPPAPLVRRHHAHSRQRRERTRLCVDVRGVLLPRAVRAGRAGVLTHARWARVPPRPDLGFRVVPAREPCADREGASQGRDARGHVRHDREPRPADRPEPHDAVRAGARQPRADGCRRRHLARDAHRRLARRRAERRRGRGVGARQRRPAGRRGARARCARHGLERRGAPHRSGAHAP